MKLLLLLALTTQSFFAMHHGAPERPQSMGLKVVGTMATIVAGQAGYYTVKMTRESLHASPLSKLSHGSFVPDNAYGWAGVGCGLLCVGATAVACIACLSSCDDTKKKQQ